MSDLLAGLDRPTLEAVQRHPEIGEHLRARIDEALAGRGRAGPALAWPGKARQGKAGHGKAPGSQPTGTMNKLETEFSRRLDANPDVVFWLYESVRVRVGMERTWYCPDFFVVYSDGRIGFIETKGPYVRDKGRARFQAAARLHPWARWLYVQRQKGGQWRVVHDYLPERR